MHMIEQDKIGVPLQLPVLHLPRREQVHQHQSCQSDGNNGDLSPIQQPVGSPEGSSTPRIERIKSDMLRQAFSAHISLKHVEHLPLFHNAQIAGNYRREVRRVSSATLKDCLSSHFLLPQIIVNNTS